MNTNEYYIDGVALPGGGLAVCRSRDLESGDSARDESGYLHRWVVRRGLRKWEFSWRELPDTLAEDLFARLQASSAPALTGPDGQAGCCLKELTRRRRDSLTGPTSDITVTLEEL